MKINIPDGPIRIIIEVFSWMTVRVYAPPEWRGWPWYGPGFAWFAAMKAYRCRRDLRAFRNRRQSNNNLKVGG